jgi:hypothetical protein
MSDTKYDNPLVAGFGTATAEDPPLPAAQHLDATDGHKVNAPIDVQERSGRTHRLDAAGEETGDGGGGDGDAEDSVADGDYEAKGVTKAHLEDEIDRRNQGREDADKISKSGSKGDLVKALQADDNA